MNLFTQLEENNKQIPLAEILRPKSIEEYFGQTHVLNNDSPLYRLLKSGHLFSFIFWGPAGCGKTTLARLIAKELKADFIELSAVASGVKEIKDIACKAKDSLVYNKKTILFIDEIHRYSKSQQDVLLPYLENGTIFLIGATTENPSFQVNSALLSRTQVIRLNSMDQESIKKIVTKGYKYLSNKNEVSNIETGVIELIIKYANGDARIALNLVENSYYSSKVDSKNQRTIKIKDIETLSQMTSIRYSIQDHYDLASAFQKSMRGSDKNAAIYYLAKLLESGEDIRFIARRMIVCASEDVGNADPYALEIALNAYKASELLGLPEAQIPLAQAVEYICEAKKSNRAYKAISQARFDIQSGLNYLPPVAIRDSHYKDAKKYGFGSGYIYTHDHPEEYQQFLPDEIKDKKYFD